MVKFEIQVSEKMQRYLKKNKVTNAKSKKILKEIYLNNIDIYHIDMIKDQSKIYLYAMIENECNIINLIRYLCNSHIAFRMYPLEIDDIEDNYIETKKIKEVDVI